MQESQARKRKASPQTSDHAEPEEKKYVGTFRFLSVGRAASTQRPFFSRQTSDGTLPEYPDTSRL